jgi:hypothetical protein
MAFVEFSSRAPTGFLIVPDDGDPEDDSQTTLIQTDWDWPGVARAMGWSGEDDQMSEAYDWISEHEMEEFSELDDYLPQENPYMSGAWGGTQVMFRREKDTGDVVAIFPYDKADPQGNWTSYSSIGQHSAASPQWVSEKTTPVRSPGEYAQLKRELENQGYTDLVVIQRASRRNPRDISLTRDWEDSAFDAGKQWGSTGAHESGVSNANVRHYGFVKWWNNLTPHTARQVRKSTLERAFNEGYAIGKRPGQRENPGQRASQVDKPLSTELAYYARDVYSRRAQHIKAVTDLLDKYRSKGRYDPQKAVKAFYYVIEGAWKEYKRENRMGPASNGTKMEAAKTLQKMIEGEDW